MSLLRLTANDGSIVEFEDNDGSPLKQGGVKDVYFTTDNKYAVAFFRKQLDAVGEDRIERLVNVYRKQIFEKIGGDYWKEIFCWPERIVKHNGKTGIVIPFYSKIFFFEADSDGDDALLGVEKEGKWFTSAKNFNKFVPSNQKGDLAGFFAICLRLSRGVKKLHMLGLAHSDLSYKNCLVDPSSGSACIIDIDGLVVPGLFPPDVFGTRDFIAPEVVATMDLPQDQRNLPCRETDLHALAVLIYEYLFHRHPLRGDKVLSQTDPDEQEKLEMGKQALFIEHPYDNSNRRKVREDDRDFLPWVDTDKLPYTISGTHLTTLFEKAFITGLHNPDERPTADDWDIALNHTRDLFLPCLNKKCTMKWFIYDNKTKPYCPYCGAPYTDSIPLFDFYSKPSGDKYRLENRRLLIYNNQYLYQWHVFRDKHPNETLSEHEKEPVGYFSFYKKKWYFINQTLPALMVVNDDSTFTQIKINKKVELSNGLKLLLSDTKNGRLAYVTLFN